MPALSNESAADASCNSELNSSSSWEYGTTFEGKVIMYKPSKWSNNGRYRSFETLTMDNSGCTYNNNLADCEKWALRMAMSQWQTIPIGTKGDVVFLRNICK